MASLMSEFTNQSKSPAKRKRGRPPKPDKQKEIYSTLTMQLESSPLSGSPSAELVSSQVVKIGEPDSYTPLMKVAPSPRRQKRRKSSSFSSPLSSSNVPRPEQSQTLSSRFYTTSSHSHSLHSRVLDKLSSVVSDSANSFQAHSAIPGDSMGPGIGLHLQDSPGFNIRQNRVTSNVSSDVCARMSPMSMSNDHTTQKQTADLQQNIYAETESSSKGDDFSHFGFELVVDEDGQAILASKPNKPTSIKPQTETSLHEDSMGAKRLGIDDSQPSEAVESVSRSSERSRSLPSFTSSENRNLEIARDSPGEDYLANSVGTLNLEELEKYEGYEPEGSESDSRFELDLSIYHMVKQQAENYVAQSSSFGSVDGSSNGLPSDPTRQQFPLESITVDTRDLVIDCSNSDHAMESADARTALKKVFRRH